MIAVAFVAQNEAHPAAIVLGIAAVVMAVFAFSFHHLTVEDQGDSLAIRFGPLPIFRRMVRYADIESVEIARTMILDGFGESITASEAVGFGICGDEAACG